MNTAVSEPQIPDPDLGQGSVAESSAILTDVTVSFGRSGWMLFAFKAQQCFYSVFKIDPVSEPSIL